MIHILKSLYLIFLIYVFFYFRNLKHNVSNKHVSIVDQRPIENYLISSLPSNSSTSIDSQATVVIENSNFDHEKLPCVSSNNSSNELLFSKKNKDSDKTLPPVPPLTLCKQTNKDEIHKNKNSNGIDCLS